jgi:hypothetical protein
MASKTEPAVPDSESSEVNDDTSEPRDHIFVPPDATVDEHHEFPRMSHPLWIHPDVQDHLGAAGTPAKRLSVVLQHLAAHGRTSRVKGCKDAANAGWRRSALGGLGNNHYYVWWAPAGTRQVQHLPLPANAVVVRDVRHHDDHSPLLAGLSEDYLQIGQGEILGEGIGDKPWTDEQMAIVLSSDPVRVVLGRPGSGKTMALWRTVEVRSNERVLYLTWSSMLRSMTEERFATFAPADSTICVRTFNHFLSELSGRDVPFRPYQDTENQFLQAVDQMPAVELGPWKNRREDLFAEMRAYLIGQASRVDVHEPVPRQSDAEYRTIRTPVIGRQATKVTLRVYQVLKQKNGLLEALFPEFAAAKEALRRLGEGTLPEGYMDFDRIVVDEAQDLTLCELSVIVQYSRHLVTRSGTGPWMIIAGDSGQTVRPTAFDWGALNGTISTTLTNPTRYDLRQSVRCPEPIARVVARADGLYKELTKDLHPDKQLQHIDAPPGEDLRLGATDIAHSGVIHLTLHNEDEATELLDGLEAQELPQTAVIVPDSVLPSWLDERYHDMVLTPALAKGLEYETAIVLDPGRAIRRVLTKDPEDPEDSLSDYRRRMVIDGLRVAASRATQTLVFADMEPEDEALRCSQELLGRYQPKDVRELLAFLSEEEAPLEQRVRYRLEEAERLFEERPRRAWMRAYQAMVLARGDDGAGGYADSVLAYEAAGTVLRFAATLLASEVPAGMNRDALLRGASEALQDPRLSEGQQVFDALVDWFAVPQQPPFTLLDIASTYTGRRDKPIWLDAALRLRQQALRRHLSAGARSVETAPLFVGNVEGWLKVVEYGGNTHDHATSLRRQAFETLLAAGKHKAAEDVLSTIPPPTHLLRARLREGQRRFEAAARLYERAGHSEEALRSWRLAASWDNALRLATDMNERTDVSWLRELERLMGRRPAGIRGRLTPAEQEKLSELVKACLRSSAIQDVE